MLHQKKNATLPKGRLGESMASQNTFPVEGTAQAGDQPSDLISTAKDKASDLGRAAATKIDNSRETAATSLDTTAATIHEKADSLPGGEKVAGLAHSAADKLSSTADYVREHDVNRMMADVEQLVKAN